MIHTLCFRTGSLGGFVLKKGRRLWIGREESLQERGWVRRGGGSTERKTHCTHFPAVAVRQLPWSFEHFHKFLRISSNHQLVLDSIGLLAHERKSKSELNCSEPGRNIL